MPIDFPLSRLENSLNKCVNNINSLRDEVHPKFEVCFDDSQSFSFSVSTSKEVIFLPLSSLYYVWVVSCVSWSLYKKYKEANCQGKELTEQEIGTERKLLEDCKVNISSSLNDKKFDLHLDYIDAESISVGDELFLCAMAWIMLHEIGHLKLNHTDGEYSQSLQEEVDADSFATDFVFDGETLPSQFIKRFSGSFLALVIILDQESSDDGGSRSHPHASARIERMFQSTKCDDEKSVAIVFPLLLLFYYNKKGVAPDIDDSDDKDYIDFVFEVLLQYIRD
ncbi:phage exclusion protein Lit family protein [Serratia nevei]|uniref:phage exclusion protein Lit family protein n=1 Tax=Serratia nevei TaxID=2703794 RepID=UPI00313BC063